MPPSSPGATDLLLGSALALFAWRPAAGEEGVADGALLIRPVRRLPLMPR